MRARQISIVGYCHFTCSLPLSSPTPSIYFRFGFFSPLPRAVLCCFFTSLKWFINGNSSKVRERWGICTCVQCVLAMRCVHAFSICSFGIDCDWLATATVAATALCVDFYCLVTVNVKMPFRKFDIVSVLWSSEPSKRHKLCRWIKMTTDIHSFSLSPSVSIFLV